MNLNDAHKTVAQQVRAARTSFYWPMLLQSRAQRRALFAIYDYCRTLDDIADDPGPTPQKHKALDLWRERVTRGLAAPRSGLAETPLQVALADVVATFDLPTTPFLALIDGMEADINGPLIAPPWTALETYCAQVAGAVGDLCLAVWGWRGEQANAFAKATGEALQLTNILRDVNDDALNGRLYLPREALAAAGLSEQSPIDVFNSAELSAALQPVFERAQQRFDEARALWPKTAPSSLRPAWVMLALYHALYRKVAETGVGPDKPRARLSRLEKTLHLTRAYVTVP